jgi:glycine dehydrogenase subunit 2
MEKLLNELSTCCHPAYNITSDVAIDTNIPNNLKRCSPLHFPNITENDLFRHFTNLSRQNYALSTTFYPLGSCTMKYNPLISEQVAQWNKFTNIHPYQDELTMQGNLEIMYKLEKDLCTISGMDSFTLQPAAGAHGELTGLLIIAKYYKAIKQQRTTVIIPDSAHGTNPSSAILAGFNVITLKSTHDGKIDINKLQQLLNNNVASIMLTAPNTLGIFEKNILTISEMAHRNGTIMYYDGANLNAIVGIVKPGDLGFDIMHINLHKTFAAPHGSGGPGAGPIGVKEFLDPFLPIPRINKKKNYFYLNYEKPKSIGKIKAFFGNFPVILKSYIYIRLLGSEGLINTTKQAVLNANYMLAKLKANVDIPGGEKCLHEFVISLKSILKNGIKTIDIAKRLLDYGYYAPTIYFPLTVEESIMIEPTETESKQTLDEFIDTFTTIILQEMLHDSDKLKNSPVNIKIGRLDEVIAARRPILKW